MPVNDLSVWELPVPISSRKLEPWPQGIFPEPFNFFVEELARSTETPLELAALTVLSTIATAVQKNFVIQVKPDYIEPLNIWTCVALPPGSRKSAVQSACIDPLNSWEREKSAEILPIRQEIESNNRTVELRIKELRQKAAKQTSENMDSILGEIHHLESKIRELPPIPQLWTSDITAENLAVIMVDNEECMAILSDEAGIFDTLAGRYSGGIVNLDLVLKGHSGTSTRVNRSSRPPLLIHQPTLTIGLCPQPHILEGVAKKPDFRGRGLLGRFLYALPNSNLGSRSLDEPPMDVAVKTEYQDALFTLLSMNRNNTDAKEEERRLVLEISPEAYDDWRCYALATEIRMGEEGMFAHIRDWAGKFPGAIARIAGLLHVMKYRETVGINTSIDKETVSNAIRIGTCLQSHALAVFDLIGEDAHIAGAKRIIQWLKDNQLHEFSRRDCHFKNKSYFKTVEMVKGALKVLEEMDYIRMKENTKVAHRPTTAYLVNPHVLSDS